MDQSDSDCSGSEGQNSDSGQELDYSNNHSATKKTDLEKGIPSKSRSFTAELKLNFADERTAEIVQIAVGVEPELRPAIIQRSVSRDHATLAVKFDSKDIKALRASVGSYLELAQLSMQAVDEFSQKL